EWNMEFFCNLSSFVLFSPLISLLCADSCELTLDPDTVHSNLSLSEGNRMVFGGREQQPGLGASVALTYKSISRKGASRDCVFGRNEKSWILYCSVNSYSVLHNKKEVVVSARPSSSNRVGVYVDCPAGTLLHLILFKSKAKGPISVFSGTTYPSV
uniref:SPRY-associated domain-containing protein n=1 Tax=Pygocentrus nattereri TaxID=42514 RepID=A0AAR2L3F6_PYGNA